MKDISKTPPVPSCCCRSTQTSSPPTLGPPPLRRNRAIDDEYKAAKYIEIAQLLLNSDDDCEAEAFVMRAAALQGACKSRRIRFQVQACRARIYDGQRKFVEAARIFFELSLIDRATVIEIEGMVDDKRLEEQNLEVAVLDGGLCR
jgi:hypothetical protein